MNKYKLKSNYSNEGSPNQVFIAFYKLKEPEKSELLIEIYS